MEKIKQQISWWISEGCSSNDINTLLIKQGELAGYSFYLAEHTGKKHTEFITLEHNRKVNYNMNIEVRMNAGTSKGASEVGAFLAVAEERIAEKLAEMEYRDLKLMVDQVNAVLNAMTMRISYLKKEHEASNRQDNNNQPNQA